MMSAWATVEEKAMIDMVAEAPTVILQPSKSLAVRQSPTSRQPLCLALQLNRSNSSVQRQADNRGDE